MIHLMATAKDRLTIYISTELKDLFEALSAKRKRSSSNMCEILMEREVEAAISSGELKPPFRKGDNEKATAIGQAAIASCMRKMVTGEEWDPGEIGIAAQMLELDPECLKKKLHLSREGDIT